MATNHSTRSPSNFRTVLWDQKPLSARTVIGPVAPARLTRLTVSTIKRVFPFCEEPLRRR